MVLFDLKLTVNKNLKIKFTESNGLLLQYFIFSEEHLVVIGQIANVAARAFYPSNRMDLFVSDFSESSDAAWVPSFRAGTMTM